MEKQRQMKKAIEFVCLGNNGRSPILEIVLKDEAKKRKVEREIEVTSSGLYVKGRHPYKMLFDTMRKAISNPALNIYGIEIEDVKKIIDDPNTQERYENESEFREKFLYYFDQVYRPLQAMDVAFRDNVLARHGLKYRSKRHQFPSKLSCIDYIITATNSLIEPTKSYLMDIEDTLFMDEVFFLYLKVKSVAEMTGISDLKGGFGKFDINFYERLYEQSRKAAPIILEKVLN